MPLRSKDQRKGAEDLVRPDVSVPLTLVGYIKQQIKIIKDLFEKLFLSSNELSSEKDAYYVALLLHNFYNAFEDLFQEVACTFENSVEDSSKCHRELLKKMTIEVPSIRPALLSTQSFRALDRLRRFRHFIRHAYNYELDTDELSLIVKTLKDSMPAILKDIQSFQMWIEKIIKELSPFSKV